MMFDAKELQEVADRAAFLEEVQGELSVHGMEDTTWAGRFLALWKARQKSQPSDPPGTP